MKLKQVLLINAISSGFTGTLIAVLPEIAADIFKIKIITPFIGVGVFLIIFALFVLFTATNTPISKRLTQVIIAIDILWVMLSIIIICLVFPIISLLGSIIISAIACWVGIMAFLQTKTLKLI